MEANLLLESHLKTLRLATFREQYRQGAEDAAGNNLGYDQYLPALAQQEVTQRHLNTQAHKTSSAPSKRPPLGTVSKCDPVNSVRAAGLAAGKIAERLPAPSARNVSPASSTCL